MKYIFLPFYNLNILQRTALTRSRAAFWCLLFILLSHNTLAFQSESVNYQQTQSIDPSILNKINPIGTDYQNSIQLLNNRFRIDSDVSAVTLVFFREYGSAPIVLVRPDGSKLYLENDTGDDTYQWFETDTYDMISLNNPMPGPWQAVGNILPESRVLVIAGITLNADAIPSPIYSGETLKQRAFVENAGTKIDMNSFKDVVKLSIDFVSTNNPSFENFGLGSRPIAVFEDNGMGLDEREGDGVFTGQFNLNIVEGEWRPVFTIRTPLFSREQVDNNIVLLPNPVLIAHQFLENELTTEDEMLNELLIEIDVDRQEIDITSMIIDGVIRHPNGTNENFYVTQSSLHSKEIRLSQKGYGIHKVNVDVFAKTRTGRDVVISVPEYSFIVEAPIIEPEVVPVEEGEVANQDNIQTENDIDELGDEEIVEDNYNAIWIALIINLLLLVIGGFVLFLIVDKRNNPDSPIINKLKFKLPNISFRKKKEEIAEDPATS